MEIMTALVIIFFIIMMLITLITVSVLMITQLYKKVPPGKVMVISSNSTPRIVRLNGAVVLPVIQQAVFIHNEVLRITLDDEHLLVTLDDQDDKSIMIAYHKLGNKSESEIQAVIKTLLENSSDYKQSLSELGYKLTT